jgi:hypothetical protein
VRIYLHANTEYRSRTDRLTKNILVNVCTFAGCPLLEKNISRKPSEALATDGSVMKRTTTEQSASIYVDHLAWPLVDGAVGIFDRTGDSGSTLVHGDNCCHACPDNHLQPLYVL